MTSTLAPSNGTNVRRYGAPRLRWGQWAAFVGARLRLGAARLVAPEHAVAFAARLFATPPRHARPQREAEFLSTGSRFEVMVGFKRVAGWRFGRPDRPAIVASHGWGGRGGQFRAFTPRLLEEGYQVVVFDHVGHGASDGDQSTLVHFIDGLDAVVRDIEASGPRVAGLLGHSLGAAAVGGWLARSGRDIPAVLVAPPTSVIRYSQLFARHLGLGEPLRRAMQERLERWIGVRWADFELPGSVAHVKARALVIHDAGDGEVAFSSGLALARAWPDARLVRTEGLGHRQILRDPQVVQDTLDFIAGRVVFARPPETGARAFGAPAPLA